jgi:hypothetical protein
LQLTVLLGFMVNVDWVVASVTEVENRCVVSLMPDLPPNEVEA